MDPAGVTPPFRGHALPGVAPLSLVDCRATLPTHFARSKVRTVASVEAVATRLPIAVIGALMWGPQRANASLKRSCPTGRSTTVGGRLSCDPTQCGLRDRSPRARGAPRATSVLAWNGSVVTHPPPARMRPSNFASWLVYDSVLSEPAISAEF